MELSNSSLQNRNDVLGLPKKNSFAVFSKFKEINPVFDTIQKALNWIVIKVVQNLFISMGDLVSDIKKIINNKTSFLLMMDEIVNLHNVEVA